MFGSRTTSWPPAGCSSACSHRSCGCTPGRTRSPPRNRGVRPEHRAVMTSFLRLRHRLLPYLHTMNHRARRRACRSCTPMYWWHPRAREAYEVPNQYLFGSELLVAPITAPRDPALGSAQVRAWLPPGNWVDVFTGCATSVAERCCCTATSRPSRCSRGPARSSRWTARSAGQRRGESGGLEVLVVVGADGVLRADRGRRRRRRRPHGARRTPRGRSPCTRPTDSSRRCPPRARGP